MRPQGGYVPLGAGTMGRSPNQGPRKMAPLAGMARMPDAPLAGMAKVANATGYWGREWSHTRSDQCGCSTVTCKA